MRWRGRTQRPGAPMSVQRSVARSIFAERNRDPRARSRRATAHDFRVSRVATRRRGDPPRRRALQSNSGHFTWTKWRSPHHRCRRRACHAHTRRPPDHLARRPRCSNGSAGVWARPRASEGALLASPQRARTRPNGVPCRLPCPRHDRGRFIFTIAPRTANCDPQPYECV